MKNVQQEHEVFNEEKLAGILQMTDVLTADGQRELALDLLLYSIRRCELESQDVSEEEQEQLHELKARQGLTPDGNTNFQQRNLTWI